MANSVDMDSKVTEVSKVDGVNTKDMVNSVDMGSKVTEVNKVDRDMEVSKADGANTKDMASNVDMDNRNTADMDNNMKVSMVQTETMVEPDIMKMKMNPACRDVTRVDRKKIMMKIMMKTMTIMECKGSMERKKMNMMKMTTGK
jgi:hypothetical protein